MRDTGHRAAGRGRGMPHREERWSSGDGHTSVFPRGTLATEQGDTGRPSRELAGKAARPDSVSHSGPATGGSRLSLDPEF